MWMLPWITAFAHADPVATGLRCATFPAPLDPGVEINTDDKTTEVGQWVAARAAEGRALASIDFEVGTKPTGYPVGFALVCVR